MIRLSFSCIALVSYLNRFASYVQLSFSQEFLVVVFFKVPFLLDLGIISCRKSKLSCGICVKMLF